MRRIAIPFRRCIVVTVLLRLNACAWFGQEHQAAQMMAMPAIDETLSSASTALPVTEKWPEQDWWKQFADPSLSELMGRVLAGNPNLKVVEARLRQSQAIVDARGAELYPTVDANLSFSAQRFSANGVQAKLAGQHFRQLLINPLVLRYHLDFWGRDQAAIQGAIDRSLASAAELADARLLLTVETAGTYFDLQAATEKRTLTENIIADHEALVALQRIRQNTGLSGDAPLLQAEMKLNKAKQALALLRAEIESAQHRLAALAGQGPDGALRIKAGFPETHPLLPLPDHLPLHLLARRPDLSVARLQVEAAAEDIKVAETAFYPDVNLFAFTGLHSVSLSDIALQGSSLAYAVGPSIEFPIFQGGRLRANLGYQQAAYDAAVEHYNASLLHALQEIADALSQWRERASRLEDQRQNLSVTEAQQHLESSLLRAGLTDQVLPLQARIAAKLERVAMASLESEQRKAAVSVIKALGGGYDSTMIPHQPD